MIKEWVTSSFSRVQLTVAKNAAPRGGGIRFGAGAAMTLRPGIHYRSYCEMLQLQCAGIYDYTAGSSQPFIASNGDVS